MRKILPWRPAANVTIFTLWKQMHPRHGWRVLYGRGGVA